MVNHSANASALVEASDQPVPMRAAIGLASESHQKWDRFQDLACSGAVSVWAFLLRKKKKKNEKKKTDAGSAIKLRLFPRAPRVYCRIAKSISAIS